MSEQPDTTAQQTEDPEEFQRSTLCDAKDLCEELSFNLGMALLLVWEEGPDLPDALDWLEAEEERWETAAEGVPVETANIYHGVNGTILVGVPRSAKKLFKMVAYDPETRPLLRDFLLSLVDDTQGMQRLTVIVAEHIQAHKKTT